jgi:hypothetical protein
MRVTGRCHCGAIAFEGEVEPDQVGICHCADCQKLTGSAFRANIAAPASGFRLLSGEPAVYIKTADSGTKRAHAFCRDCGTPIYATSPTDPQSYSLRIGTLDQRMALTPRRQIWTASALPWSSDISALPASERQ